MPKDPLEVKGKALLSQVGKHQFVVSEDGGKLLIRVGDKLKKIADLADEDK